MTFLPTFFYTEQLLSIADYTNRRHNRLIDQHVDQEAGEILPHFKIQDIENCFLFLVHHPYYQKSQRHYQQSHRSDDVIMTEDGEQHAGKKHKSVKQIDERNNKIHCDKKGRKPGGT